MYLINNISTSTLYNQCQFRILIKAKVWKITGYEINYLWRFVNVTIRDGRTNAGIRDGVTNGGIRDTVIENNMLIAEYNSALRSFDDCRSCRTTPCGRQIKAAGWSDALDITNRQRITGYLYAPTSVVDSVVECQEKQRASWRMASQNRTATQTHVIQLHISATEHQLQLSVKSGGKVWSSPVE